jgi:hypothetical protein
MSRDLREDAAPISAERRADLGEHAQVQHPWQGDARHGEATARGRPDDEVAEPEDAREHRSDGGDDA